MKGEVRLTKLMRDALEKAATSDGLGSWDFAAGVLGALKKRGWVVRRSDGRYTITAAGEIVRMTGDEG